MHNFEKFNGPSSFDPIKLIEIIVTYRILTKAVVRYFTSYCNKSGKRLLQHVALGNEMVVDAILGNTVMAQCEVELK